MGRGVGYWMRCVSALAPSSWTMIGTTVLEDGQDEGPAASNPSLQLSGCNDRLIEPRGDRHS